MRHLPNFRLSALHFVYVTLAISLASIGICANANAQERDLKSGATADKAWRELTVQLPTAPKADNLIVFYKNENQSFAIDTASIQVLSDDTIRYTLVSTSTSGAKNISHEGLRCQAYEKKLYAFGRADGSWSSSRRDEWDQISNLGINKQHSTLYKDYFCEGTSIAGKTEHIVRRFKQNEPIKHY